jgi:pimeloyl-ACP methyl ester carboxylesterase
LFHLHSSAYYVLECIEALEWGEGNNGESSSSGGGGGGGGGGTRTVVGNIHANANTNNSSQGNNNGGDIIKNDKISNEITGNNERENKINLIGHSMGAGVSVVLVAAFPELFASVTLLEGAGPLARNAKDCSRHVRAACQRRLKSNKTLFPDRTNGANAADGTNIMAAARAKVYRSVDAAIEARLDTTRRMPGDQYLSIEAARDMVLRATVEAAGAAATSNVSEDDNGRPVTFRHDPRLQWPSLQYYTREQVEAFYSDVCDSNVPVLILMAEDGWPVDSWSQSAVNDLLKPCHMKLLKGSHHFHADPDTVGDVAAEIVTFLKA